MNAKLIAPGVESLESRTLLAATPVAALKSGVLTITGTASNDVILVGRKALDIVLRLGTKKVTFAAADVKSLKVLAAAGDDRVAVTLSKRTTIDGGDGDDFLSGGNGPDTITGGAGRDLINGNGGNDTLDGGDGNDIIGGNEGNDVIRGGKGDDTIAAGFGTDTVFAGDGDDLIFSIAPESKIDTIDGGAGQDILMAQPTDVVTNVEDVIPA
jgi:Ca2+-binding RTX toxin-like protein